MKRLIRFLSSHETSFTVSKSISKIFNRFHCGAGLHLLEPLQKVLLFFVIILQVASALIELLSLWLLTKIMSAFVSEIDITTIEFVKKFDWNINTVILLVSLSSLLAAFVKIFSQAMMIRYVQTLRKHFAGLALQNFQKKDFIELKNTKKSEASKVVLTESDQIVQYYFQPLTILTSKLSIVFIFVGYSFFRYTTEMMIVFSALFVIYSLYYFFSSSIINMLALARNEANSQRVMAAEDFIRLAKDFKISGSRNYLLDHFDEAAEKFKKILSRLQIITFIPRYLVEAFAVCMLCAGIYLSTQKIFIMDVEFLITVLVVSYRVLPAVQGAFASKQTMDFGRPLFDEFHVADHQLHTLVPFNNEIQLRGVVTPEPAKHLVYNFDELQIHKGDRLIITGPSGIGKTTFLEVILGLRYNPSVQVECDKIKLKEHHRISEFAYVEQHPNLFNASVIDNICMRSASDEDIKKIVNIANHWNDEDLLNLVVNNIQVNDEGTNLSGGQRQKIALMRSLQNLPKLLVLDEATSGFDELSLKKFINLLNDLEITTIWVTHDKRVAGKGTMVIELVKNRSFVKVILK